MTDMEMEALVGHATEARGRAYAPYSKFPVGAALVGESGKVYLGCNVENAAFPLTICAERAAIARAVCDGEQAFRAIAIVSEQGEPCAPCGACRQVLNEFNPEMTVIMASGNAAPIVARLCELLPRAFGPGNLPDRQ